MDFLRMEGESNVLALLPVDTRKKIRDRWYRDVPENVTAHLNSSQAMFFQQSGIIYKTDQPWPELAKLWKQHLKPALNKRYELTETTLKNDLRPLNQLADLKGKTVSYLPETAFIIVNDGQKHQHYFTLLRNSAHSNVSELFKEEIRRLQDEDTLTLVSGFLGAYPNAFYKMELAVAGVYQDGQ